ncbi:hypothetical protein JTE90_017827 [Oedothorax gibbosus]|uniref:EGF-like domain-containing protein n=1 Tax=Oedothorax gibbosus TaxID=931172 RepID=A0AAV6VBQ3_9ARAC|nr:hypothetical protein JTE90_017827 [Oedothorax gibbosus]
MAAFLVIAAVGLLVVPVLGDLEPVVQRCCTSGELWARSHAGSGCEGPAGGESLQGAAGDRSSCVAALYICCVRARRAADCERGKEAARTRGTCRRGSRGGEEDCCEGCLLGLQTHALRMPCTFSRFAFGAPWDEAFRDCCQNPQLQNGISPSPQPPPATSRCAVGNPCSQICEEVGNAVRCSCVPGYKLSSDLHTCEDVDECVLGTHTCNPSTERCSNVVGGFQCLETRSNPQQRPASAQCPTGYAFNADKRTCDDVDECMEGLDTCDRASQICQNSHGSFQCVDRPRRREDCPAGFKWSPDKSNCQDVDECRERLDDCSVYGYQCRNTVGGYECDPCPRGQRFDTATDRCVEADKCSPGSHNCKAEEVCLPTENSFQCVSKPIGDYCSPGLKPEIAPDGVTGICVDVNECEEFADVCNHLAEVCVNAEGSYECVPNSPQPQQRTENCPAGFHYDHTGRRCRDIDECAQRLDNCDRGTQDCVNTNGSYECTARRQQCPPGYRPRNGGCEDVNECAEGRHKCLPGKEQCENVPGAYRCQQITAPRTCPAGRQFDASTGSCEDVNECRVGAHSCDPSTHTCENSIGSYRCVPRQDNNCPHGYRWNQQRNNCDDVNECVEGLSDCDRRSQVCVNTAGSYQCQSRQAPVTHCGTGFTYDAEADNCADVDECESLRPCRSDQRCENSLGSYRCVCLQGYTLDAFTGECRDVNECQLNLHSCEVSQRCDNTLGSFTCVRTTSCGTGYTLNAGTNNCEDDDECVLGSHNCGPGFVCRNMQGTFRCDRVSCPRGQRLLSDGTCKVVVCPSGMQHDDVGNCADVNECAQNPSVCRLNQRCANTLGSYRCQNLLNCGAGFELNEVGDTCIDVDECERRLADCGTGQTCKNRQGGYTCECPRGYTLSPQRVCEDIDECQRFRGQVCASNSECINTQGSYTCNCNEGFRTSGTDKSCADIDECAESPNICQQTCNNVWGSYQCSCRPGYTLGDDERSCQDINECEVYGGIGSLCIGFCVNEPGSFKCECPDGYRLSSDGRTCQDIDECQESNVCGDEQTVCLNTRGGHRCNRIDCPPNYQRDKEHRNRCKRTSRDCHQGTPDTCLKDPLSFSFNYITFVSSIRLPLSGQLDLFTMRGPRFQSTTVQFSLDLKSAVGRGRPLATRDYFRLRRTHYNEAMVALVKSLKGPQDVELDLVMKIYHNGLFGGTAVAKIYIFVTEHEF